MIYKICSRCGTKFPVDQNCPNDCHNKNKKELNRFYDKYSRKNKDFYNSLAWRKLRMICHNKYNHICLYSFFKYKRIIKSETIHHIIEIEEDRNKSLDMDNLIPVSNSAHIEIHSLYNRDKINTQKELFEMIKKWEKLYETER